MSIVSLSQAPLAQLDALILDGRFHEAADNFCQPACGCHEIHDRALRTMETRPLSPCARPRKKLLPNGAFRNVNYDHALLGFRERMQLFPLLF